MTLMARNYFLSQSGFSASYYHLLSSSTCPSSPVRRRQFQHLYPTSVNPNQKKIKQTLIVSVFALISYKNSLSSTGQPNQPYPSLFNFLSLPIKAEKIGAKALTAQDREMDEDDEIQSPESDSRQSPAGSNGRIMVTVAAPSPASNSALVQNTLALALPIQQQPRSNGGGREDCWSEGATSVLIDAWGERYLELSRGNLKQKHWKEVADIVSSREDYAKTPKTDIQCKNRIDTVKKKFKLEKAKMAAGAGHSIWPFFDRLDDLIGTSAKIVGSVGNANHLQTQKVPLGIPVGVRSMNQYQHKQQHQPFKNQKIQIRRRDPVDSDSSDCIPSPVSTDSFPPDTYEIKRPRVMQRGEMNSHAAAATATAGGGRGGVVKEGGKDKGWGGAVKELTQAILKFGEAYEQAESSKLQQVVEMEKQRMKFAKEVELQRMQFFMKTQLEISQLKHGRRVRNTSNHHQSNNNNSDSTN